MAFDQAACCADTMMGTVHRFPHEDGPCQCGAVVRNRRQHARIIVAPRKPDGSRTGVIVTLLTGKPRLNVAQIAAELKTSKTWVRYALVVLERAHKVIKADKVLTQDGRGYWRSIAIYDIPRAAAYPDKDTHV